MAISHRVLTIVACLTCIWQMPLSAQHRGGVFDVEPTFTKSDGRTTAASNPYSVGTLIGVTLIDKPIYEVIDSVVYLKSGGKGPSLASYALPSFVLIPGDFPIAVLLPIGANITSEGSAEFAAGIGLSLGWSPGSAASSKVDIGLGFALVWVSRQELTGVQQASYDKGTRLAPNQSLDIGSTSAMSVSIGFYVTPHF